METKDIKQSLIFKQQALISKYAEDVLELKPIASTFDKTGHVVLFSLTTPLSQFKKKHMFTSSIRAHVLAHKDSYVEAVEVGSMTFEISHEQTTILLLETAYKFRHNGIGKLLLQQLENLAVATGCQSIYVGSLLNKTRLKSVYYPKRTDFASDKEFLKALEKASIIKNEDFFDKNLYFYSNYGYKETKEKNQGLLSINTVNMKKENLRDLNLAKTFTKTTNKYKPEDKMFKITQRHIANCAAGDRILHIIDRPSRPDLEPIIVKNTQESLDNLTKILNSSQEQEN